MAITARKRKIVLIVLFCVLILSLPNGMAFSGEFPGGKYYSIAMANTLMERYPDPAVYPWKRWCYPQGYVLMGMDKLWQSTGDKKYYDYILSYVDSFVKEDGSLRSFSGSSMDDMMPGSTLVWAYQHTGKSKYKIAADKVRRAFDDYPRTSDGLFWHGRKTVGEVWVDGVFMGQMFLAKYGKYVGDSEYCFNEAAKQLILQAKHLTKGDTGLLLHAWDEDKDASWANTETGLSSEVWSEGLGWYSLVIIETLDIFPKDHPQRSQLVKIAQDLMGGLKNTQDPKTGLWYQVVDKGDRPDNWHDTSGSAMFTYAIQRAIELGLIDEAAYGPVVEKGYQGILTKAQPSPVYGLVDIIDCCDGVCVQDGYDIYINYKKKLNAKEAVPGFLWATWIVEKPGQTQ